MMKEKKTQAYAYMFISRNKDNRDIEGFKERSRTFLSTKTPDELMPAFEAFVNDGQDKEVCRFYQSVNPRDLEKAKKKLIVALVESDDADMLLKMDAKAVSLAMQPDCAAERRWLFDFDCDDADSLQEFIEDVRTLSGLDDVSYTRTPHGYAVITSRGFDTRELMKKWNGQCELKRDAMLFVCMKVKQP